MNTQENITQENIAQEKTETKKAHKIMDRPILSTILLYLFVTLVTAVFQLVKIPIWGVTDAGAGGQILGCRNRRSDLQYRIFFPDPCHYRTDLHKSVV